MYIGISRAMFSLVSIGYTISHFKPNIRISACLKILSNLLSALLLTSACLTSYAAEAPILLSESTREVIGPSDQMGFILDPIGNLTLAEVMGREFQPLQNGDINFGFTTDKIWLYFSVENSSENTIEKTLRSSARFMRPLEIYLRQENSSIKQLLKNDETHRFGERPLPELRFLAADFSLAPFENSDFYIRFGAGGQASMTLQISSREEALLEQSTATIGIAIYVSVLFTLILVNFFHFLAVRQLAYLIYVGYEFLNILYVSHMEGFTFQYLWPNLPQLNADATPMISAGGLVIGNIFAMIFLETKKYAPFLHRVFQLFITVSAVMLVITLFAPNRIGNQITAPLLPLSLILSIIAAAVVMNRGHYAARYFLVAWSIFAVGSIIWSGSILGIIEPSYNIISVYKFTIAAQAIILSMGLADQVRRLNNQYVNTQGELIENLQGRLEDARERIQLEKKNEDTMLQLLQKSKLLASTSHDINQPIQSLRAVLKSISMQGNDSSATDQLTTTLDHMESVLGSALDDASIDLKKSSEQSQIQTLLVETLLKQVVAAFVEQAQAKGIRLESFDSKAILVAQQLPLKRCLMNLVSNAIQSTNEGGILIGVRKRGDRLLFQVFDTGRGIPQDTIPDLVKPLIKGDESSGHGLGLAIVSEICHEYGWHFDIQSQLHKGSCFSISVPTRI